MALSSEPITVRLITEDDVDLGVRIARKFAGNDVPKEHVLRFLQHATNLLFVAFAEGDLVGFLTAHRLDRFKDLRKQIFVYEIDVAAQWRGRGIGRKLMNAVLEAARLENTDEVFVLTNHSNVAARRLYESAGGIVENGDDLMYVFRSKRAG